MRRSRPVLTARLTRWGRALAALAVIASAVLAPVPSGAVEAQPAGNVFGIQTNGPNGLVTLGDWYSSNAVGAGGGYHYIRFTVPCGWPAGLPVYVDLFSPEMNRVSGALAQSEEPNGAYDSTQFEVYGPGATVGPGYASPGPGAGIPGTQTTFQPGGVGVPEAWTRYATLAAPVACGGYVVRSQVLTFDPLNPGGTGNDQNGWRIRVGTDADADPTNAPPANYDNPDGLVGTNDEIALGVDQASFQQDSGALACQTFFEYVSPGQASIAFNNFDMDGNTRVRYYAPSDPTYDPAALAGGVLGTLSNNGQWNGGTLATRVGDTILNPESGWWRFVTCISSQNQFIQEGEAGRAAYYTQPPTPNLTIAKSDGLADVSPGQTITYTIDVNNTAAGVTAGAANTVIVKDTLPSQFTYVGCAVPTAAQGTWVCSQAAGVVTFTQTGWINAGAAAQLTVTATVDQGAAGSKTNTATVNYTDLLSDTYAPVSATDVDTITPRADLSITKTDSADPVNQGQAFTYTLTATNNGPSDATGVTVSDTVPAQFTVTGVASGAGSCGFVGQVVACTRPTFLSGATWPITVSVTTGGAAAPGTYSDTATISGAETDPTPANNSASETTTISVGSADLSITKSDSADPVIAGANVTYTLTVTNLGPSDATGVVVVDPLPGSVVYISAVPSQGSCLQAAGVVGCAIGAIPLSGVVTITIVVTTTLPGVISNTATVSATSTDPVPANDADTETTTVLPSSADLSIVKTDAPDPVAVGATLTYAVVVTNNGPADATGVTVTDTLPAGVTFGTATPTQGSCVQAAGVVTCALGTVVVSATATVTITVTPTVAGSISNTATVSATTLDPIPANNSATATTAVGASADLSITKTDGLITIKSGMSATYSITLTNNGPSGVPAGIVVTDQVPVGTTGSESEANCTLVGTTFICTTTAVLASGSSVTYQLTVVVGAAYILPTLVNTATITSTPVPDPNLANNSATDTDTVTPIAVDLSVVKTDSADPVQPGDSFTYTITVTNAGPDDATGVVLTDPVPAELTVTAVASSGSGTCIAASNLVTCSIDPLAVGAVWTITVSVDVPLDATSGTVTNTATVADAGDTDPSNDSANETTTIGVVAGSADLAVTKTVSDSSPKEGDTITYTVNVTNNGPDDATGVQVTDLLPGGLTYVSDSPSQGSYDPATGLWDVGSLAFGVSAALQIQASVDSGTARTTITNGASVSAEDQTDPAPNDDADTAPADVAPAGGTAFTGFPGGPAPFVWLFAFAMLGLLALGFGRASLRRTVNSADSATGANGSPSQPPRYLAEPFFFKDDGTSRHD